jgi:hypothetical protein
MVAITKLDDDHVPVPIELVWVMVLPIHAVAGPAIVPVAGTVLTVTPLVAEALPQLLVTVYDITVDPVVMPVTNPSVPTVATAVLDDVQLPPLVALSSRISFPVHTVAGPVMVPAVGSALIVMVCIALHPDKV